MIHNWSKKKGFRTELQIAIHGCLSYFFVGFSTGFLDVSSTENSIGKHGCRSGFAS